MYFVKSEFGIKELCLEEIGVNGWRIWVVHG